MRKKILLFINNKYVQAVLYNPFSDYIVWSILSFVRTEAKKIPKSASVLDAGAGELRYKKYFDHCKYVSQDLCVGDKEWYFNDIDIKSNIYNIPVENESFDYILCAQVLEHLEFPDLAFKEFSRILKKNGKLLLTAPLGQGEHQTPYDFFRYTKYSLKSFGERYSLKLSYIKPAGGIFINLEYILWQAKDVLVPFRAFVPLKYFFYIIFLPFKYISGIVFVVLDIFDRDKNYTNNYSCIYEKK